MPNSRAYVLLALIQPFFALAILAPTLLFDGQLFSVTPLALHIYFTVLNIGHLLALYLQRRGGLLFALLVAVLVLVDINWLLLQGVDASRPVLFSIWTAIYIESVLLTSVLFFFSLARASRV